MAAYGYVRASTLDQDLIAQRQALRAAECGVIRQDRNKMIAIASGLHLALATSTRM